MPDASQIPHLIQLLDDECPEVSDAIAAELYSLGPRLEDELATRELAPNPAQQAGLREIVQRIRGDFLRRNWGSWFQLPDGPSKLEAAYSQLSPCINPELNPEPIAGLLDDLAARFHERHRYPSVFELATFLFEREGLVGADDDYYDARHSDLASVITGKRGIPISLTAIFMLVGERVGIKIEGCNFPGHFLARCKVDKVTYLIDCFGGGRFIRTDDFVRAKSAERLSGEEIVQSHCSTLAWMGRSLRNLVHSYQRTGNNEQALLMVDLLNAVEREEKSLQHDGTRRQPAFRPGQLVRHRRYGYRGVIVDYDLECKADDGWYQHNHTQPTRDQPWYHVLVDGAEHTTYAAQTSLESDDQSSEIRHPLLTVFFSDFVSGRYIRNSQNFGK
jgi:hemimethylated DNA binding protein